MLPPFSKLTTRPIAATQDLMAAKGIKLSYTAYIVKAAADSMAASHGNQRRWEKDPDTPSPRRSTLAVGTRSGKGIGRPGRQGRGQPVARTDRRQARRLTRARPEGNWTGGRSGGSFTISNHVCRAHCSRPRSSFTGAGAILGVGKLEKRVIVVKVTWPGCRFSSARWR
jgi:2-oxoglutarate dehydrogenase E2 component (dihydrolipoamide succinyltransferase)